MIEVSHGCTNYLKEIRKSTLEETSLKPPFRKSLGRRCPVGCCIVGIGGSYTGS